MIRKVIQIDEEKCNGCGVCADACHEGATEALRASGELIPWQVVTFPLDGRILD